MMSAGLHPQTVWYRIGWWVLVVIAGASIVNHVLGPFLGFASGDDQVLAFLALAAMNIYALVVLLTAYRRGERWAWWVTWVFVAFYGLVFFYAPDVGSFYLGRGGSDGSRSTAHVVSVSSARSGHTQWLIGVRCGPGPGDDLPRCSLGTRRKPSRALWANVRWTRFFRRA